MYSYRFIVFYNMPCVWNILFVYLNSADSLSDSFAYLNIFLKHVLQIVIFLIIQ